MKNYIRNVVRKVIRKYDTLSPTELAKALNITVIYAPLGNVWGIYKYMKKNRVIFVNSTLSEIVQTFVIAHELGHAILHTKSTCYCYELSINALKKEREANIFSAEFLLNKFDYELLSEYSLAQIASMYNVPVGLLEIKLKLQ